MVVVMQVIATACLHLAAKIHEAPKAIRDVCLQCERIRHAKHLDLLEILRTSVGLGGSCENVKMIIT